MRSWDQCAAVSCDNARERGRPYCPECAVMFAGDRPHERKPMPIVEVVPSLVETIPEGTPIPQECDPKPLPEDQALRRGDLEPLTAQLAELHSAITALQSSGSSPPDYADGKKLCDMEEITHEVQIEGPGRHPIHIVSGIVEAFHPYGFRMIVTIPNADGCRAQANLREVTIMNVPQTFYGNGGSPAEVWDRHWPVPVNWRSFSYHPASSLRLVLQTFEPHTHVWIGIAGIPGVLGGRWRGCPG